MPVTISTLFKSSNQLIRKGETTQQKTKQKNPNKQKNKPQTGISKKNSHIAYNKHKTKCSSSSLIIEMQIQYHDEILLHVQIEKKIWGGTTAGVKEDYKQWELSCTSGGALNVSYYFRKQFRTA